MSDTLSSADLETVRLALVVASAKYAQWDAEARQLRALRSLEGRDPGGGCDSIGRGATPPARARDEADALAQRIERMIAGRA